MTAPVLLWCATAVALLTTLAGATEIGEIDEVVAAGTMIS